MVVNGAMSSATALLTVMLVLVWAPRPSDSKCTSIVVSKGASAFGGTMTTHNVDCLDCDHRLGYVPAQDWPEGSKRNVYKFRSAYPRVVQEDRGETWKAENLDTELPQREAWMSDDFEQRQIVGTIPQASHTFSSLEGLYGIINEKQVAIGESTCGSPWVSGPLTEDCPTCNAMFDISELSRIAMERASTAREAIQIMGSLAEEHGFYGSEWDDSWVALLEAGESLQVTDPQEAWVFHIIPDDTSYSAVWAAQRVPDGHFTVVANQFIIRTVPKDDPDNYMYSSNLWEVAERNDLWKEGDGVLDFSLVFTRRPYDYPHFAYSARRAWRTFNLLAPSLGLPMYTDTLELDYPFSAAPDKPLTPQDIIGAMRDHYEGTPFDLTKGVAAGPYGDVDRYDPAASADGSVTMDEALFGGYFERSVALFRTAYTLVTQSRDSLPDQVGGVAWLSQYKPSVSTMVPVYVGTTAMPTPMTMGSLFKYTKESTFWAYCSVGNWMAKYRMHIYPLVEEARSGLETKLFEGQDSFEKNTAALLLAGDDEAAAAALTDYSAVAADAALSTYTGMFYDLISAFHDGYHMNTPEAETIKMTKLFYPKSWLETVGFFSSLEKDAAGGVEPSDAANVSSQTFYLSIAACALAFSLLGVVAGRTFCSGKNDGFEPIE